jgi:hypothetical protein
MNRMVIVTRILRSGNTRARAAKEILEALEVV